MIDFDVTMCRISAVKALRLVAAVRQMLLPWKIEYPEIQEMVREFRESAAELQRVEPLFIEARDRVLADGD